MSHAFTGLDKLARLVYDNETIGSTVPIIQLTLKMEGRIAFAYPKLWFSLYPRQFDETFAA